MTLTTQRTKAQRRWNRKGITHEAGWWSGRGQAWNFLLVIGPETAAFFKKNPVLDDEFVRLVAAQFIHKGRKP